MNAKKGRVLVHTTTINTPYNLEGVFDSLADNSSLEVEVVIVGDEKTPRNLKNQCDIWCDRYNVPVDFWDIDAQEQLFSDWDMFQYLPRNSANRRMFAHYYAISHNYDAMVSIDDDNYPSSDTYFNVIQSCLIENDSVTSIPTVDSESGWYNVYAPYTWSPNPGFPIFPRGFPWEFRTTESNHFSAGLPVEVSRISAINGSVLGDPDIDAVTRLTWPFEVTDTGRPRDEIVGLNVGTWCSFNNQNTVFFRDALSVFYTPTAGGRNSDIWSSYVLTRVAHHFRHVVAFGAPVVVQRRNPHVLFQDLKQEFENMEATDVFVERLRTAQATGRTYHEFCENLLTNVKLSYEGDPTTASGRHYTSAYLDEYLTWIKSIGRILNR